MRQRGTERQLMSQSQCVHLHTTPPEAGQYKLAEPRFERRGPESSQDGQSPSRAPHPLAAIRNVKAENDLPTSLRGRQGMERDRARQERAGSPDQFELRGSMPHKKCKTSPAGPVPDGNVES